MPVEMLANNVGVILGGVNIGVVLGEHGSVAMIDTGLNETNAKKALKAIASDIGRPVSRILNTHAHADHFGGNATVVKRTGAQVWAPPLDEAIIRNPILQPSLLFAGADPPPELRISFLLADPSPVDHVIEANQLEFEGVPIEVVPLPGHSPRQVGFLVEGVFFCADVVLPSSVLEKYRIPYLYSVGDHIRSLERAVAIDCSVAISGHGPQLASVEPVVAHNAALVQQVLEVVVKFCVEPRSTEEIFQHVLESFDAPVMDASGFYLLHPTIHAFLSELVTLGEIVGEVVDRRMLWRRS
ncbi:MAG: MBL fold metallo-hydrolase [Thermomicrobiales bacterium]